jgi:thiol-disulfide isomerase/thioredoxin
MIDPATDAAVGQAAPTLRGVSFDGTPVSVLGTGRPTVVLFLAHWCPHCQAEVPQLQEWRDGGQLPADVDWASVSTGVRSNLDNYPPSAWLADEGWTVPTLADSEDGTAAVAYGLTNFPYFVAVRADGTVAARATGELGLEQVLQLTESASGGSAAG